MRLIFLFAISIQTASTCCGEDGSGVIIVPLNRIWALDMPGTHRITTNKDSATEKFVTNEGPILANVPQRLASWKASEPTKPAFAVQGSGIEALRNINSLLASSGEPANSLSSDQPVCIVFFTREYGRDVHIQKVNRVGTRVEVQYRFVPHIDAGVRSHFALIPLGELPPGKFRVEVVAQPMEDKFVEWGVEPVSDEDASRIVSGSFRFEVREPSKNVFNKEQ